MISYLILAYLLVASSLILAGIEDARTRLVHLYLWIPLVLGATWLLYMHPAFLLLVGLFILVSEIGVRKKLLGEADPFAFAALGLLGFSWSFLYAGLAFTFLLIGWSAYLVIKGKLILSERVPAIPIVCLSFILALIAAYY